MAQYNAEIELRKLQIATGGIRLALAIISAEKTQVFAVDEREAWIEIGSGASAKEAVESARRHLEPHIAIEQRRFREDRLANHEHNAAALMRFVENAMQEG
jgi:hypothetical protein